MVGQLIAGSRQCHLCDDKGNRCTAEVVDAEVEHGLCIKHTAAMLAYIIHVQERIAAQTGATS